MTLKTAFSYLARLFAIGFCVLNSARAAEKELKFDFGPGKAASGFVQVMPSNLYSKEIGWGFEPGAAIIGMDRGGTDPSHHGFCTSEKPFSFSVTLPEGNYKVTVTLGGAKEGSTNTIKAELRRLMLEDIRTAPGEFATKSFIVNVRTPNIAGDGEVHLKPREREMEMRAWDEKLTLEFNGARPCVCALQVQRVDVPTVYLLGDSTVCDQPNEPWNSWGQMLTRFFKPDIAVANNAESGETLKNSIAAHRLDKVLSTMKPGDYLFIQYGHNDMKDHATNALETYKTNLKNFVAGAREKGGRPVLVTSMERKAGVENDTLAGYPDAVHEIAKEEKVPLIDLHATSKVLYKALGTNLDKAFQDGTHHNNYGSYQLAKCIVQGIKDLKLPLADHITDDFKSFDPSHPDPVDSFQMPASPGPAGEKPLGN
jgi:lysophospholipase L1-like esterase